MFKKSMVFLMLVGIAIVGLLCSSGFTAEKTDPKPPAYIENPDDAVWITFTKKPERKGIYFKTKTDEGDNEPTERAGKEGWMTLGVNEGAEKLGIDAPCHIYLKITDKSFRKGAAPWVKVIIEYFDEGDYKVGLEYDSSDENVVKVPKFPGAFKNHKTNAELEDTGEWTTTEFLISDAYFDRRSGDHDFRLDIPSGENFVIGSFAVIKLKEKPAIEEDEEEPAEEEAVDEE